MARVAVVTGGTRGIGRAIAEKLHRADYQVAANFGGNEEAARRFTDETGIKSFRFDVSDYKSCEAGLKRVTEELGSVDILVNNAGITRDAVLHRMTPEQWGAVIATNLTSCFNMCRLVIDGMRERNFGRIVNIGSINGQAGQYGQVNYAAAKSGIHGFTKALAQEGAGKGVTVNAVAPGYIDTDMVRAVPAACWKRSWRGFRPAGSAMPTRSRAPCCSWCPTIAASSPARRCRSMAASICTRACFETAASPPPQHEVELSASSSA